jgi:hypothetical protein
MPEAEAKPGGELLVCCCFKDFSTAEEHTRRIVQAVPGSAVRIGAKRVDGGSGRMVFEVYASHPDMTPEKLAERLAEYNCPVLKGD